MTLPQGDTGPDTAAQRRGSVIITHREAGAVFRRKRRDHILETMRVEGTLTPRQCAAGIELHERWCGTQLSGDAAFTRVYVDTSPNPSAIVLAQSERVTRFIALSRHVPPAMRGPVEHVALKGKRLRDGFSRDRKAADMHSAQLKVALDILANAMGI